MNAGIIKRDVTQALLKTGTDMKSDMSGHKLRNQVQIEVVTTLIMVPP